MIDADTAWGIVPALLLLSDDPSSIALSRATTLDPDAWAPKNARPDAAARAHTRPRDTATCRRAGASLAPDRRPPAMARLPGSQTTGMRTPIWGCIVGHGQRSRYL